MEKTDVFQPDSENLLEAHACFQEEYASLGGKWRYLQLSPGVDVPQGWSSPDFDDKKWERVLVPGIAAHSATGSDGTVTGLYRKSFTLSRELGGRRIVFRFACAPYDTQLWVNGIVIGSVSRIQGSAEFDITHAMCPDKNLICIRICTPADTSPMIPGDVGLYTLPGRCITDIRTALVPGMESMLQIRVTARSAEGFTARVALMEDNRIISFREASVQDEHASVTLPCPELKLWCAETPHLYRIGVILWDGIANYHTRELTFGIRQLWQSDGVLTINGQPEKLFATCFPLRKPDTGALLSLDCIEANLNTLRSHNFNAVWLTEDAPDEFYSLCDRIGIYVLEETGITGEDAQSQCGRLYAVRANHPCVIGWDLEPSGTSILHLDESMVVTGDDPAMLAQQVRHSETYAVARYGAYRDIEIHGKEISGFLAPDGHLRSSIREAKAAFAPVAFQFCDCILTMENHSRFLSGSDFDARYVLTRDGIETVSAAIDAELPPMSQAKLPIETKYDIYKPGRYHLSAEFRRKSDGCILAKGQWEVGVLKHIYDENPGGTIREESGQILLRSQDTSYAIGRDSACIDQISVGEQNLLSATLTPVFSILGQGLFLPDEWDRFTARWRKPKPSVLEVDQMTRTVTASFRLGSGLIQTYRLFADGSLSVELRLRTGKTAPERIGWHCTLDPQIIQCSWFGLGPDPAEREHHLGQYFGIHTMKPEHASMRDSVYELNLVNEDGKGFRVRCTDGLRFSLEPGKNGAVFTVEGPSRGELKPHTTYTFALTICPIT